MVSSLVGCRRLRPSGSAAQQLLDAEGLLQEEDGSQRPERRPCQGIPHRVVLVDGWEPRRLSETADLVDLAQCACTSGSGSSRPMGSGRLAGSCGQDQASARREHASGICPEGSSRRWLVHPSLRTGRCWKAGLTQARRRARPQVHPAGRREARRHRPFLRRRGELCGRPRPG